MGEEKTRKKDATLALSEKKLRERIKILKYK